MTISFDLDIEDIVAFQDYLNQHAERIKKTIRMVRFLLPTLSLVLLIVLIPTFHSATDPLVPGGFFLLISTGWMLCIPKMTKANMLKKTRKNLLKQQAADPALFGLREMTFSEEGVRIRSMAIDLFMNWSRFMKTVQSGDYCFLFLSDMEAFIIPGQKLNGDDRHALKQFMETLETP